jgi:hypothetical protein
VSSFVRVLPVTTQAHGPQEHAKKKMKKQTKAIKTLFDVELFTVVTTIATINCETHMPAIPG